MSALVNVFWGNAVVTVIDVKLLWVTASTGCRQSLREVDFITRHCTSKRGAGSVCPDEAPPCPSSD